MSDHVSERLSEFLDGELSATEVREIELHLRDCPPCTREIEGLRRVRTKLAQMPLSEPSERVWQAIRGGLEAGHDAPAKRWGWPLVYAATAAALAAGIVMWAPWRGQDPGPVPSTARDIVTAPGPGLDDGARVYGEAAAAWREVLLAGTVRSEMSELLASNMDLYDRAIEETREAIARDPGDALLRAHLARMLKAQVRFLRQAGLSG